MKTFAILLFVLFSTSSNVYAHDENECETKFFRIENVKTEDLLQIFKQLSTCVQSGGKPEVYVHGIGGSLENSQMFFDLMRTSGIYREVSFITAGAVRSASNIVWLAADTRIGSPGTTFMIHSATWNMGSEDNNVRVANHRNILRNTTRAVLISTGNKDSAEKWNKALGGNTQGIEINAEQALKMGWLTEIRRYK